MNTSDDNKFDEEVAEAMSQYLPQSGMILKVNPWSKPIHEITWGMILTTITFKLFYLDFLLPTLGFCLIYIGCRTLRNVNSSFSFIWKLSILRLILNFLIDTLVLATPINLKFNNYVFLSSIIFFILQMLFIITFRKGLKLVFLKEKVQAPKDPLLWVCILQIIIYLLALISRGLPSIILTFVLLVMVICYFIFFKQLYGISNYMKSVGYSLINASVGISNKVFISAYVGCFLLFIIIFSTFSYHVTLTPTLMKPIDNFTVRTNLINKGFPPEIIGDISDKYIQLICNAKKIDTSVSSLNFKSETPPRCTLESTTVCVQTSDNSVYSLVYFKWKDGASYWNDGFRITSEWNLQLIAGTLLYDKDGKGYCSPMPRLRNDFQDQNTIFGSQYKKLISGGVSYPFNSSNQRGYIFYKVDAPHDFTLVSNYFDYFHYMNPIRYPYTEPEDNYTFFDKHLRQHVSQFQ
ncbi:hypothetical protein SAMN02745248_02543 [Hathewaya proteolytica DSM 3090]|uniref:Uncharacterized protein n=1 Tax=Hathewaya proteolytica DSM 3090 TaxID=1121331 RepID=A0A1M6SHB1_9CLOT|nr:hypothetical protein [Hathewaya proteolytica]SHK43908.1 hypothetical protein SAMN02745248_02543 [Hathewaya proteolytica DSM 3090]